MILQIPEKAGFGNTPLNCPKKCRTQVSIGWLDGIIEFDDASQLKAVVDYLCGKNVIGDVALWLDDPFIKGERYEKSIRTVCGVAIGYNEPAPKEGRKGRARISIPARALDRMTIHNVWMMCITLKLLYKFRATRIDISLDFYDYPKLIKLVEQAGRKRNFSGRDRYFPMQPMGERDGKWQITGNTHYFGSLKSDKMLRVYDKNLESKGEKNCIRWELQLRRGYAQRVFEDFTIIDMDSFDELYHNYLAGVALGVYRFVDRKSGDRLSRQDELKWYEELAQFVANPLPISKARRETSLGKSMSWIIRSIMPTLVMIEGALGKRNFQDWMTVSMRKARERLTPMQKLTMQHWVIQGDSPVD
jgi:hypothetical protein